MKKLNVSWNGIEDSTGYLFSFAKSLSTAVKNSPYAEFSEDIIATSGFAFRMWVHSNGLCPSATSIWDFNFQKTWVENGGIICDYVGRYWNQDNIEKERRLKAIEIIKDSIDRGIPAVSWDIDPHIIEWGLITGYDEGKKMFNTLSVKGEYNKIAYDILGKRDIPILSVLTIKGKSDKTKTDILNDTLKIAVSHLKGKEWCENAKGLNAYPALTAFFEEKFNPELSWNMEYYLGTYGGLKLYAYKYFEKNCLTELANLYKQVYCNWKKAFDIKISKDINDGDVRKEIAGLLKDAYECEAKAVETMEKEIKNLQDV